MILHLKDKLSHRLENRGYVNKESAYLRKSSNEQMITLQNRLFLNQQENIDNKKYCIDKSDLYEQLDEIERERSIQIQSIKPIAQLKVDPNKHFVARMIPDDFVKEYEYCLGRLNVQKRYSFGLVNFTSENASGDTRFIIVTESAEKLLQTLPFLGLRLYRTICLYL